MKSKLRMSAAALVAAFATQIVFGFGHEGHEAIGTLAAQKLADDAKRGVPGAQTALDEIKRILGNDMLGAGAVATWADYIRLQEYPDLVKAGLVANLQAAKAYVTDINDRFPGNGTWHFCDLALGSVGYEKGAAGTNDNDIIQGFAKCIATLEAPDNGVEKDRHACALRFLVHLAGDIHQPLHVACGYYRVGSSKIVRDPDEALAQHLPDDRGANELLTEPAKPATKPGGREEKKVLHATWDDALVWDVVGRESSVPGTTIAAALYPSLTPDFLPAETGDYHEWPTDWAKDSVVLARSAYKNINLPVIQATETAQDGHFEIKEVVMVNFDKTKYLGDHVNEVRQQLLKAAFRLAELLEHIQWHD